jgi:hypothetical protein
MALDLNGMMRKIAALIANADNVATPPEAARTYREKAEELLRKYQLEEESLIMETGQILPIYREVIITRHGAEFRDRHFWLWTLVAAHCGVRYVTEWKRQADNHFAYVSMTVGYDVDVRLAELIFSSALLVFGQCLEPDVDTKLSDVDNVYRLRSAGIPRNRIANLLWGASMGSSGAVAHGRVSTLYKQACEARGEDARVTGRNVNAKTYREAYARSFCLEFGQKLRLARDAADAAVGALVSVDRAKRVEEAFYARFPSERPVTDTESDAAPAGAVKPAKARQLSKATINQYHRMTNSPAAQMAAAAASDAVGKVRLDRAGRANRIEESGCDTKEIGT